MKSIIQEKQRVSAQLRSRVEGLQLENIRLVDEVQETDRQMDTETRNILEKYDQFMTNLSKLKQGYEDRVEQARGALAGRRERMESELRNLEMQVEEKVQTSLVIILRCSTNAIELVSPFRKRVYGHLRSGSPA